MNLYVVTKWGYEEPVVIISAAINGNGFKSKKIKETKRYDHICIIVRSKDWQCLTFDY